MNPKSAAIASPREITRAIVILSALLFTICSPHLRAQVGDNNPTGVSGIFNGQAGGCGYDPYTGNATRAITDISVAGAVGDYPLRLVRMFNSRTPSTTGVFSYEGGWNHNYNWIMEDSPATTTQNAKPVKYTVDFPDGRVETFQSATWDTSQPCTATAPCYRVKLGTGSAGVRERVVPINPPGNMYAFVILPDGGKVKFSATQYPVGNAWFYKYQAVAIIDPHGLETTLTWETYGNGKKRLTQVKEPGGRYLQFSYPPNNSPRISQVQEFMTTGGGGRIVQYNYYLGYVWLDNVVYYGNTNWTAHYQYVTANVGADMPTLLWTCDDPMYPGPMHKIAYTYRTTDNYTGNHAVYGQISSENHYDGTTAGPAVSTLTVPSATTRIETRGDGKTRTFTYTTDGYLLSCTDFMTPSHTASQDYDSYKYIKSVTDRNGKKTDFTNDIITGNVLQVQFPLTPEDTQNQGNTRPTVNYTYTNNYYLHTIQGENNLTTTIIRDSSNRVTEIDYPDGGKETFPLYNAFNQVRTHVTVTNGTETFTYDGRGLLQEYRNPDNVSGNPTARYGYDTLDRVKDVTDVLGSAVGDGNHSSTYNYNDRGQVTVTTMPAVGQPLTRPTIGYTYNDALNGNGLNNNNIGDGTLVSVTDELGHVTSYTYDDYRRLKSVTPPNRNGTHTTNFYYGVSAADNLDDYKHTDSNVTWAVLPSSKKTKTVYDDNRRKSSVTVGDGTPDAAMTSYGYDSVGNLTSITNPLNHDNVSTLYDARDRLYSITVGGRQTTSTYDTLGRKASITRPNGQLITFESYDNMNRLKQQRMTQTPNPDAVSKYEYYVAGEGQPVGFLKTFEDPRIYNSGKTYTYEWDSIGRKKKLTYPPDLYNVQSIEQWSYDTSGRLSTFTNRNGKIQTFGYDALNRVTGFTWNDGGLTPSVSFGYDAASRLTSATNVNANVTRAYYDDNLLQYETEQILLSGGRSKTVTYTYDADGNRGTTQYPAGLFPDIPFSYTYTNRNQLKSVTGWADYVYDARGNLLTRTLSVNNTQSGYVYDTHDRVTQIGHSLNVNNPRTAYYGYWDENNSNNRKWTRRDIITPPRSPEDDKGEAFVYDVADQATGVLLDVLNPQSLQSVPGSIQYDGNGNRLWFGFDLYETNYLNQYTKRTSTQQENPQTTPTPTPRPTPTPHPTPTPAPRPGEQNFTYDPAGNMSTGFDNSSYAHDAQNRVLNTSNENTTMYFEYDALNRQVSRRIGTAGTRTFSVWDGWDLIQEYQAANNGAATAAYLYGATGLIADSHAGNSGFNYYYQDASGSTSHLADSTGHLLEWYRYDLDGTPFFYDANDSPLTGSNNSVRHLFTGQQWYKEIGLYDLRNRFYSPDIGRFLQPDPIGFDGDATNLYRYCGNNPVVRRDARGLQDEYEYYPATPAPLLTAFPQPGDDQYATYITDQWINEFFAGAFNVVKGGVEGFFWPEQTALPWLPRGWNDPVDAGQPVPTGPPPPAQAPDANWPGWKGDVNLNPDLQMGWLISASVSLPVYYSPFLAPGQSVEVPVSAWSIGNPNGHYDPGISNPALRYVPPWNSAAGQSWNRAYWASTNLSLTANYFGGIAGPGVYSPHDLRSQYGGGLDPISGFLSITIGIGVGAMEPGLGCFVSGTRVLMGDGTEKPIEAIQAGETVLAWNEETRQTFQTRVVKPLHHEAKAQTLFDVQLEDGRRFTSNNNHPVYVIEDDGFIFTRELAERFAKGQPITFQNYENQPVRVASINMRTQICDVYNLEVEGQGQTGHTYYAGGVLVHNSRAGNEWK